MPVSGLPMRAIANMVIGVLVFLSAFVMFEPAPSDLLLCLVVLIWSFCGLRLTRSVMPMVVLMSLYVAGGLLSFTQLSGFQKPVTYMATTAFLVISSVFYAAILQDDTERRMRIIERSYVASAIICALIGILAYFGALPRSDLFTLYDRAKGAFKDPNVFGPFLVLPLVVLTRAVLTTPLIRSGWRVPGILILLAGIFLSFSRAAWGMAVLALVIIALLAFVTEFRPSRRLRMLGVVAAGLVVVALLLAIAISIPAVQEIFVQRFKLVQDYDAARLGRFERHIIGFFLIQEHPLGIGPFQFGLAMGEDEHNMWLKGFTVYGWLGGFAYIGLVVWTLAIATPLIWHRHPWTPFLQSVYAVYLGHLLIHNVIDNDHWRHLFLIYGVLWGAYAVERRIGAGARGEATARPAVPAPLIVGPVALPRTPLAPRPST